MDITSASGSVGTPLIGAGPTRQIVGDATVAATAPRSLVADSARLLSTSRRSRVANATFALGGTGLQQHQRVHDADELTDLLDPEDKFSHYDANRVVGNHYGMQQRNRESRERRERRKRQLAEARKKRSAAHGSIQDDIVSAVTDIVVAMPSHVARSHARTVAGGATAVDPAVALMLKSLVRTAAVVKATHQIVGPPHATPSPALRRKLR